MHPCPAPACARVRALRTHLQVGALFQVDGQHALGLEVGRGRARQLQAAGRWQGPRRRAARVGGRADAHACCHAAHPHSHGIHPNQSNTALVVSLGLTVRRTLVMTAVSGSAVAPRASWPGAGVGLTTSAESQGGMRGRCSQAWAVELLQAVTSPLAGARRGAGASPLSNVRRDVTPCRAELSMQAGPSAAHPPDCAALKGMYVTSSVSTAPVGAPAANRAARQNGARSLGRAGTPHGGRWMQACAERAGAGAAGAAELGSCRPHTRRPTRVPAGSLRRGVLGTDATSSSAATSAVEGLPGVPSTEARGEAPPGEAGGVRSPATDGVVLPAPSPAPFFLRLWVGVSIRAPTRLSDSCAAQACSTCTVWRWSAHPSGPLPLMRT